MQAMEEQLHATTSTKAVYLSALANKAREATKLMTISGPAAELAGAGGPMDGPLSSPALPSALEDAAASHCNPSNILGAKQVPADDLSQMFKTAADKAATAAKCGPESELAATYAASVLNEMATLCVTRDLLASTGLGKKVRSLVRGGHPLVASAARSVVEAWRQMVL